MEKVTLIRAIRIVTGMAIEKTMNSKYAVNIEFIGQIKLLKIEITTTPIDRHYYEKFIYQDRITLEYTKIETLQKLIDRINNWQKVISEL